MANVKEKMIKKLGTPVMITYPEGTTKETKSLITKAGYFNSNMIAMEAHRKCDFVIADNVTGGCIVENLVTGEIYLTVALYPASYKDKFLSTVFRALVVNATLTTSRNVEVADDRGRITKEPQVIIENLPVYIMAASQELRQYNPGLHLDAEYIIYMPKSDMSVLDKIIVTGEFGDELILKSVSNPDILTYQGVSILEAKTETRY